MSNPYIPLKAVSNESLLDMYFDYSLRLARWKKLLEQKLDKEEREYYYDKLIWDGEYFEQIKIEILSRMTGMEID